MSATSILVKQKLPESKFAKDHRVSVKQTVPVKIRKVKVSKFKKYRPTLELIGTTLLTFAVLALYKVSGLHDWWIQLVRQFV